MNPRFQIIGSSNEVEVTSGRISHAVGRKRYELTNHLGNVLTVISDRRIAADNVGYESSPAGTHSPALGTPGLYHAFISGTTTYIQTTGTDGIIDYYTAEIISSSEYSAFGVQLQDWGYQSEDYRYGFNRKESNDEIHGKGNSYDFGARIYDSRLGRWSTIDPSYATFPQTSPYAFVDNNPIRLLDIDGHRWVNPYVEAMKTELNLDNPDWSKIERLSELANEVTVILEALKKNDPELYSYIENAKFKGTEIDVTAIIYISEVTESSTNGAIGVTRFGLKKISDDQYMSIGGTFDDPISGSEDMKGPYQRNTFMNILLYDGDQPRDEVLANEAGDVMFAVENSKILFDEMSGPERPYERYTTTHYSFNVENLYIARKTGTYAKEKDAYPLKLNEDGWSCDMQCGDNIDYRNEQMIIEKK